MTVASYLHRLGFNVHYPGLPVHPGKEIHDRLASGPGAVLSFTTGNKELSERIVGATRLWGISVSFGCRKPTYRSLSPSRLLWYIP